MTVQKLFKFSGMPKHMVIKDIRGDYFSFYISPARKITEKDLTAVPYYIEKDKRAMEAEPYMYRMYGLQSEK